MSAPAFKSNWQTLPTNTNGVSTQSVGMSGAARWSDGTPKSTNNAFTVTPRVVSIDVKKLEAKKAKRRAARIAEYDRKLLAIGKTRKQTNTGKV